MLDLVCSFLVVAKSANVDMRKHRSPLNKLNISRNIMNEYGNRCGDAKDMIGKHNKTF